MSQVPAEGGDVSERLTDLHYAIFEELPEQGAKLGLTPMVASVAHVQKRINSTLDTGEKLTSAVVQAEIRSLRRAGYVERVLTLSGVVKGWQRTKLATEALEARKRAKEREAEPLAREVHWGIREESEQ